MVEELIVACWNIERGGIDADGGRGRLNAALEVLEPFGPHLFLQQECRSQRGGVYSHAVASELGLVAREASPIPESDNVTSVMYDPIVFDLVADHEHTTRLWHAMTNPVLRLRDATKPLTVASLHLCSYDPAARASEARRLTSLADHGRSALFGGDFNSYPHRPEPTELPDWADIADPVHYAQRTRQQGDRVVPDTEPDRILAGDTPMGCPIFIELGHYAGTKLNHPWAQDPTATLWRTDQGGPQRIDRLYATPDVAKTMRTLDAYTTQQVRKASDHALLILRLDYEALRRTLSPTPQLAPHNAQ